MKQPPVVMPEGKVVSLDLEKGAALLEGGYRYREGQMMIGVADEGRPLAVVMHFVLDEIPPSVIDILGATKGFITDALGDRGKASQMLTYVRWTL